MLIQPEDSGPATIWDHDYALGRRLGSADARRRRPWSLCPDQAPDLFESPVTAYEQGYVAGFTAEPRQDRS